MSNLLLEAKNLSKRFCRNPRFSLRYALTDMANELLLRPPSGDLRPAEFWALKDVSFTVEKGEVFGVIGRNGAGKSTLINLLAGVIRPTCGEFTFHSKRVALIEGQGGLSPLETGLENIRTQLSLHGIPEEAMPDKERAVIEFSGVEDFIEAPVGTYSLGMRLRLAFSIYTQIEPDLFIVDEALSAGDFLFRRKFLNYLRDYIDQGGSILLCSHEMFSIQSLCKRCIFLEKGRILKDGDPVSVVSEYTKFNESLEAEMTRASVSRPAADGGAAKKSSLPNAANPNLPVVKISSLSSMPGESSGQIEPGKSLIIEMEFISTIELRDIVWGISIGTLVHPNLATLASGFDRHDVCLPAGQSKIRCFIPNLPLPTGQYHLRAVISDKATGLLLAWSEKLCEQTLFSVISAPSEIANMVAYQNNVVHIAHEWKIEAPYNNLNLDCAREETPLES